MYFISACVALFLLCMSGGNQIVAAAGVETQNLLWLQFLNGDVADSSGNLEVNSLPAVEKGEGVAPYNQSNNMCPGGPGVGGGGSLKLQGAAQTKSYIRPPGEIWRGLGASFTISFWMKLEDGALQNNAQTIVSVFDTVATSERIRVDIDLNTKVVRFQYHILGAVTTPTSAFDPKSWNHVAVTYQYASSSMQIHINGSNVATSSVSIGYTFPSNLDTKAFTIGQRVASATNAAGVYDPTYGASVTLADFRLFKQQLDPRDFERLGTLNESSKCLQEAVQDRPIVHYPLQTAASAPGLQDAASLGQNFANMPGMSGNLQKNENIGNASPALCWSSGGADFNGASSSIELESKTQVSGLQDFTVSIWFKETASHAASQKCFISMGAGFSVQSSQELQVCVGEDLLIKLWINNVALIPGSDVASGTTNNFDVVGTTQFVMVTRKGTTVKVYVNGILRALVNMRSQATATLPIGPVNWFALGRRWSCHPVVPRPSG